MGISNNNTKVGLTPNGEAFYQKELGGTLLADDETKRGLSQITGTVIATAAVKTLNATPVELIAAPGAGLAIVPRVVEVFLDYGTTAYDGIAGGEDLVLRYTDGSGNAIQTIEATGFLDATADESRIVVIDGDIQPTANAAVVLHMATGEIATGDSPLQVRVLEYDVIKLLA